MLSVSEVFVDSVEVRKLGTFGVLLSDRLDSLLNRFLAGLGAGEKLLVNAVLQQRVVPPSLVRPLFLRRLGCAARPGSRRSSSSSAVAPTVVCSSGTSMRSVRFFAGVLPHILLETHQEESLDVLGRVFLEVRGQESQRGPAAKSAGQRSPACRCAVWRSSAASSPSAATSRRASR